MPREDERMKVSYVKVKAEDGTEIEICVPVRSLPSDERAEELRALYREHVEHPDGHWKGRATAVVPVEVVDDVVEAMDFMGSIVDQRYECDSADGRKAILISNGYWAHGF